MILKLKDTKNKEILNEYFKFKEKYEYKFTLEELNNFLEEISKKILKANNNNKYNTVFIPETENKNLIKLAKMLTDNVVIIYKKNKEEVIKELEKQNFQKKEKESLLKSLEKMKVIKMAEIKGNQRKRFIDILFNEVEKNTKFENSLLLDDSAFSGFTYKALKNKIPKVTKEIVIFSKEIGEKYE